MEKEKCKVTTRLIEIDTWKGKGKGHNPRHVTVMHRRNFR